MDNENLSDIAYRELQIPQCVFSRESKNRFLLRFTRPGILFYLRQVQFWVLTYFNFMIFFSHLLSGQVADGDLASEGDQVMLAQAASEGSTNLSTRKHLCCKLLSFVSE